MVFNILGKQVEATHDVELAEAIRRVWLPGENLEGAMHLIAEQAFTTKNTELRTDSVGNFLLDLQLCGMLRTTEDPWLMFGLDKIKLALFGPMALPGWEHKFIWSNEMPHIASISSNGISVIRPIVMAELPEPRYQEQWIAEHLRNLRH